MGHKYRAVKIRTGRWGGGDEGLGSGCCAQSCGRLMFGWMGGLG